MRSIEKARSQHYEDPRNMDAFARQYGVDAATLDRHLMIMGEVVEGRLSGSNRAWLHAQAAKAGVDQRTAERVIEEILSQPNFETRARSYITTANLNQVSPEVVQSAMELHRTYRITEASTLTEDRLQSRDREMQKNGQTYKFEDQPRFEESRQESGALRKALEASMVSSGLIAPKARSIEESQLRAQRYADSVANRLESRIYSGKEASLRDTVEDAYLAADALEKKADVGLADKDTTVGQVNEDADRSMSYDGSLSDTELGHE